MQPNTILSTVSDRLGGHTPLSPLAKVRVDMSRGVLQKFVFAGGGSEHADGVSVMADGFEIPGFDQIDVPSLHGMGLRTITKVPDKLKIYQSPQTGMVVLSYGMKPPPVLEVTPGVVMGCYNSGGMILVTSGDDDHVLARLASAFTKRDVAFYLGDEEGAIGNKVLNIAIVSAMSDEEKKRFLEFDASVLAGLNLGAFGKSHFKGTNAAKGRAATHVHDPYTAQNDEKKTA